jgi:hypothetical protein
MKETNQLKKYIQAKRRLEQKLREITREIEQLEQREDADEASNGIQE